MDNTEVCRQKFPNEFHDWVFGSDEDIMKRMSSGSEEILVSREFSESCLVYTTL